MLDIEQVGELSKKSLIILILKILQQKSDENHHLTQQDIMKSLRTKYGVECDRRTVKSNIEELLKLDYDIVIKNDGCFLGTRTFEDAELRLLIDSVICSKNITVNQTNLLIKKLVNEGTPSFDPQVNSHIQSPEKLHKGDNKQLFTVIDNLNRAISAHKKVSFIYNAYGIDFKLHPKRDEKYILNPYQMVCANGFYYLIGNNDKYDNVTHYRLDKISQIEILEEKAKPTYEVNGLETGLNVPKHMAEHIYMFSGESIKSTLDVCQSLMNELIDWFGKDFEIVSSDGDRMKIQIKCNENALYYWALQYGPDVEVLEPLSLRERLRNAISDMNEKYSKN